MTPRVRKAPPPPDAFARHWLDTGALFLSAFYQHLRGAPVADVPDVVLAPGDFAESWQWRLCAVLIGHREAGLRPTLWTIRAVGRHVGEIIPANPAPWLNADPRRVLVNILNRECSAAGLGNYLRTLEDIRRRREAAAAIGRAFRDLGNPAQPIGDILNELSSRITAHGGHHYVELAR